MYNPLWYNDTKTHICYTCKHHHVGFPSFDKSPKESLGLNLSSRDASKFVHKTNLHHALRLIPCVVINLRPGIRKLYIVSGVSGLVGLMINYIRITDRYEWDIMWCVCW